MTPEERQAIVDDIRRLHQDRVSVADIAQKLHFSERTVQHVIERGTMVMAQANRNRLATTVRSQGVKKWKTIRAERMARLSGENFINSGHSRVRRGGAPTPCEQLDGTA